MADKKIEIRPKGDGSYSDVLLPRTSADQVKLSDGTDMESEVGTLKQSVVDGKNGVETAINGKGGTVSEYDGGVPTFNGLVAGVQSIQQAIGNATASDVLEGHTFSSETSGIGVSGTMPDYSGDTKIGSFDSYSSNFLRLGISEEGYYDASSRLVFEEGDIEPENIKSGVNIFGVTGNLQPQLSVLYYNGSNPAGFYNIGYGNIYESGGTVNFFANRIYFYASGPGEDNEISIVGSSATVNVSSFSNMKVVTDDLSHDSGAYCQVKLTRSGLFNGGDTDSLYSGVQNDYRVFDLNQGVNNFDVSGLSGHYHVLVLASDGHYQTRSATFDLRELSFS